MKISKLPAERSIVDQSRPKIQRCLSKKLFEKHYARDSIDNEKIQELTVTQQTILTIKLQGNPANINLIKRSYAQNILDRALEICFEVSKEFTVWMVKILIFNQLGDGFEPFSVTLFKSEKVELQVRFSYLKYLFFVI